MSKAIYRLAHWPDEYLVVDLDWKTLAKQLNGISFIQLRKQETAERGLGQYWKDGVACGYRGILSSASYIPDVSLLGTHLMLSQRAYDVLAEKLQPLGELLPLTADGQPIYLFNCQNYGKEDKSRCVMSYLNGLENGYEHVEFDGTDVSDKLIFKSKFKLNNQSLYVAEDFKLLCDENELRGIRFETELLERV